MNSVGYFGQVKLQMKMGTKTYEVHNMGLPTLFQGLCMNLCGVDNSDFLPTSLDVIRSVSGTFDSGDFESIIRNQNYPMFATPTYYYLYEGAPVPEGCWVAQFQTVIHSEILTEDVSSSMDYHRLYVRSASGAYLAYIDIDLEELQIISDSTSLEVTWLMGFVDIHTVEPEPSPEPKDDDDDDENEEIEEIPDFHNLLP